MTVAMQSYFEDLRIQKTALSSSFSKQQADESGYDQVQPALEDFEEPSTSTFASDFDIEVVCDNAGTFSPLQTPTKPSCPVLRGYFDHLREQVQGSCSSILLPSHQEGEEGEEKEAEYKPQVEASDAKSCSSSSCYSIELVHDNAVLPHAGLLRKQSIRRLQQEFSRRRARSSKNSSFRRSESEGTFNTRHSYPSWRNQLLPPMSSSGRRKKSSSSSLRQKDPSHSLSNLYGYNDRFSSSPMNKSISDRRNQTFESPVSVMDTPLYYNRPPISPSSPSAALAITKRRTLADTFARCQSPSTSGRSCRSYSSSSTRSSVSVSSQSVSVGTFEDCSIDSFHLMDSPFKSNNGSNSSLNKNIILVGLQAAPFSPNTTTTPTSTKQKLSLRRPKTSLSPRSARWGVLQRQESDSALIRPARSCDK